MKPLAPLPRGYFVAALVPLLLLASALAWLALDYDSIPARMPVHFTLEGEPDRWENKSPQVVFGMPVLGVLVELLLLVLVYGMVYRTRADMPQRRGNTALLTGLAAWVCILFAGIALAPLLAANGRLPFSREMFLLLLFAPLAGIAVFAVRAVTSTEEAGETPAQGYMLFGEFYSNAADPAWMAPKQGRWGYTVNLARPGAWMAGALLVLMLALPLIWLR